MFERRRPFVHLAAIVGALVALAVLAWWYTSSRVTAPGLPEAPRPMVYDGAQQQISDDAPWTPERCAAEGGVWNECGSACPDAGPDVICIQMCVPRCEGLTGRELVVSAYFQKRSDDGKDCALVHSVRRATIVREKGPEGEYLAALQELLEGPGSGEEDYATSIPKGAEVLAVEEENGIVTAHFNEAFNRAAGSCRVTAIRSQVEETLKQFSAVKSVVISVGGEIDAVLQP